MTATLGSTYHGGIRSVCLFKVSQYASATFRIKNADAMLSPSVTICSLSFLSFLRFPFIENSPCGAPRAAEAGTLPVCGIHATILNQRTLINGRLGNFASVFPLREMV